MSAASGRARAARITALAALSLALLLAGCRTTYERRDWSAYDGPGARYFQQPELEFPHVDDPLEPANRVSAGVDYALLRYVLAPITAMYRNFVPGDVREHVEMAGDNWLWPVRVINNLLQAKWSEAGEETARFAVNTTVGVLGLFDPAKKIGLEPQREDFGQTFAKWGWKKSTYLFLPFYGPSTVRDGLGKIPDELCDPANYFFPAAYVRRLNATSNSIEDTLRTVEANYDPYEPARTLYTMTRDVDVTDFSWRRDETGATQTLDSIFLTFEDPTFPSKRREGEARIEGTHREALYSVWLQDRPAPIVYLVPGLGGHRLGNATLGLAELFYLGGNSVVTISNPTNWEFVAHAASVHQPGFAPVDAHDLHVAITAIDRELSAKYPGRFTSKRLGGISLGGFHTLFVAANEERDAREGLVPFDVYIAMDVPVSLEHAMQQLDRFYNAPLGLPEEERKRELDEILAKVLYLSDGNLEPTKELPFTHLESEFIIGLSYRVDLQYVIMLTQERHDLGVLRTKRSALQRAPAYREISEYSYMEYMYGFVLPYYARRGKEGITFDEAGARAMFDRCDLHALADELRANDKVRLFANENDFLLRPDDLAWLRDLLGDRAKFFPAGGHLGNLHRKEIQAVIESTIEKAAAEQEEKVDGHASERGGKRAW